MKILLISNQHSNKKGVGNPIMYRMLNALRKDERINEVEFLPFYNSFSTLYKIRKTARYYDVVHVHFGGIYALVVGLCLLGLKCGKIITFHGTDIHAKQLKTVKDKKKRIKIILNQQASFLSLLIFDYCGFVSEELYKYVPKYWENQMRDKFFFQPLGVDYDTFIIQDKEEAQNKIGLKTSIKYILFSDVSNTNIKRRDIAEEIVKVLGDSYQLLIMCGVKSDEVPYYINSCDFLLLTSDEEGSPNIIRECLSLNKRVFSVDVGDANKQLANLINSSIISRDPLVAATVIQEKISLEYVDNTRETKREVLDFEKINQNIIRLYLSFQII